MPIIRYLLLAILAIGPIHKAFGFGSSAKKAGIEPTTPAAQLDTTALTNQSYATRAPQGRDTVSPIDSGAYVITQCKHPGHPGVDLAAPGGTPIYAVKEGTVKSAGWIRGYGNTVVIDHGNNTQTLYAHMQNGAIEAMGLQAGQSIRQGQRIGSVGNTGTVVSHGGGGYHLHFEVRYNGAFLNPIDEVPEIMENANGSKACPAGHSHNQARGTPSTSYRNRAGRSAGGRATAYRSGSARKSPAPKSSAPVRRQSDQSNQRQGVQ